MSNSNISTRPATEKDTEFARKLFTAAYQDVIIRQFGIWDKRIQSQIFKNDWSNPGYRIIMYDGVDCGYYLFQYLPEYYFVYELVISPDYQGKGIGTYLLNKLQRKATKNNVPVKLQVLKQNKAAILYISLGFVAYGEDDTHFDMSWKPDNDLQ